MSETRPAQTGRICVRFSSVNICEPLFFGRADQLFLLFSEFLFFPLAAVGTCDPKVRCFFGLMQGRMLIRQQMTRDRQPYLPLSVLKLVRSC
jgi:hypothetical protein